GTMEREPESVVPMYGNGRILRLATGSYSVLCLVKSTLIAFGFVWFPLPTPIRRFLPSGETATAVGYQPVGMKPFTPLRDGVAMSITATQLLSALATKRVLPSDAMARASGVEPSGARGKEEGRVDRLGDDSPAGVDHRDGVARRAGNEEPVIRRVDGELVGVLAHGDPRGCAQVGRIDDVDRATGPVRDVEKVAIARQYHVVGPAADRSVNDVSSASGPPDTIEPGRGRQPEPAFAD